MGAVHADKGRAMRRVGQETRNGTDTGDVTSEEGRGEAGEEWEQDSKKWGQGRRRWRRDRRRCDLRSLTDLRIGHGTEVGGGTGG